MFTVTDYNKFPILVIFILHWHQLETTVCMEGGKSVS